MTAINNTSIHEDRRTGFGRQKKNDLRIDMTPMVDLGFLLSCFFVITTELAKPVLVSLNVPKPGPEMPVSNSDALTVILTGNNTMLYYQGNWKDAKEKNEIFQTNFSAAGIRNVIIEKKNWLQSIGAKQGKVGLMLLVKSTENADYKNIVDILDEIMINDVRKYAFTCLEPGEKDWIRMQHD